MPAAPVMRMCISVPALYSPSFVFCLPSLSKFSGASQRSNAALRAGHSLSSMEK